MTLDDVLAAHRVLLCVGAGGVGKTTTAAALATGAARRGRRTAVLTVDPAARLKDALGLDAGDGALHRVRLPDGAALDAMLLDVKRTFDDLVRSLADDPALAARLLANPVYRNLSGVLAGTAEYMAVETVHRLHASGAYDLIVVDTPPSRHAVDFLDAPARLVALLESRAFRILQNPASILPEAGSRLGAAVLRGVLAAVERFTGLALLGDIAEFATLAESLTGPLARRMQAVAALLASTDTAALLVTAPEPRLIPETQALAAQLATRGRGVAGVIVNRALAPVDPATDPLPEAVPVTLRARVAAAHAALAAAAGRQTATLAPLLAAAGAPVLATVPVLGAAPSTRGDLIAFAELLLGRPARA